MIKFVILLVAFQSLNGLYCLNEEQNESSRPIAKHKAYRSLVLNSSTSYLLADLTDSRLNLSDPIDKTLLSLLQRDGPDMRPSRDYKNFPDVTDDIVARAWRLIREHASVWADDFTHKNLPLILDILNDARVGERCTSSVVNLFDRARRLDSWAARMFNSWGSFPPIGAFDGAYSEIGSYHACVNIPVNKYIDHAHYCSLTFKPIVSRRPDYDLVVNQEPENLLHLFERKDKEGISREAQKGFHFNVTHEPADAYRDAFDELMGHSQSHNFVYYKVGTCWPIHCTPFDIKRIVKLISRRNILVHGPVKCYSRFGEDYDDLRITSEYLSEGQNSSLTLNVTSRKLEVSIWDKNDGIYIWKPFFNRAHRVALAIITLALSFILSMTLIDLFVNRIPRISKSVRLALEGYKRDDAALAGPMSGCAENGAANNFTLLPTATGHKAQESYCQDEVTSSSKDGGISANLQATHERDTAERKSFWMSIVDDCSLMTNAPQFFRVSESQLRNDILCLNGIRCITMVWVIMSHTMLYNDWSAFGRIWNIETSLKSLVTQPLFNGTYLVDSFFLMSGLLSSFTAFRHSEGASKKFNSFAFILGRWLRLTPQIFFASMLYIVLPSVSSGPHWWPIVGEYSEHCVDNWWINVLHLQAFFRVERMCNFVTWWISIDFFYHFLAVPIIWIVLHAGHRAGRWATATLILSQVMYQIYQHYKLALPPNLLATIPQTGAMWSTMTLGFFWQPYTHAVPFFFGLYIGYLMALKRKLVFDLFDSRRALIGWLLAITMLLAQNYSTYWWVTGKAGYPRLVSTIYYTLCSFNWATCLCWIILACHHGYGGFINKFLSARIFIVLGKASYFVYLTHFVVLFIVYGNQGLLLEPTTLTMSYINLGNIILATLFGVFLCIAFELPWLKTQRRLMKYV